MPIKNQEAWDKWVKNNTDEYGGACVNVAQRVMEILDENKDFDPHQIICQADDDTKTGGITGFMAGAVAQMVSTCHSRGEEFRRAWNGDVGKHTGQEDAEGVLNPACVTLST